MYNILLIIIVVLFGYFFLVKKEHLTNEDIDKVESICPNMTFEKFLKIFNNNIDDMSKFLSDNGIPVEMIGDYTKYDKIVSYLISIGRFDKNICEINY
jgi:hypothetical protein